jgi:cytoskeletal protein CcmA (bactofilin family)
MWNSRPESDKPAAAPPVPVAPPRPAARVEEPPRNTSALIGRSITVKGDIVSEEDLTIDGRVEGTIAIGAHNLTIGAGALVQAELKADTVIISGAVKGNVSARNKIEIRETGSVQGDISAPIVAVREGAEVKGRIDTATRKATERARDTETAPQLAIAV